jgi:hypothetical protein
MTGFNSKRLASKDSLQQAIDTLDGVMHPSEKTQRAITALRTALRSALAQPAVSLDTLDHMPYQGRETRPDELAPEPVAWAQNPKEGFWCWCQPDEPGAIALYTHPAAPVQSAARAIANEQSYDTGLWFVATTVTEEHLQAALRRLTAAVEGEPVARTPLTDAEIYEMYNEPRSDAEMVAFARTIEAAHGIKGETT